MTGFRRKGWKTAGSVVSVAIPPHGQEYPVDEDGRVAGTVPIPFHPLRHCKTDPNPCCFHSPSPHNLRDADMTLRMDKYALIERRCEHGIGHDDPDSAAWIRRWRGDDFAGLHGCDGCCV